MTGPRNIGAGTTLLDLNFQGMPGTIGAYLLEDAGERALVEIGPTSTLDTLLSQLCSAGVDPESISRVLLTHIHLDHAGAAGTFLRRFPQARLFVHEIGAPHLIEPERLLSSATRIYGDMMDQLWGDIEPVPAERVTMLREGDTVPIGKRSLRVYYTPGHASHHVAYVDDEVDAVFTGDVAGVRLQGFDFVRPPTPPPDLDLELWAESLQRLRALHPRTLYLTHFGPFEDVTRHLDAVDQRLTAWGHLIRDAREDGQDRVAIVDNLRLHGDRELLAETDSAAVLESYELATPYGMTVDGYLRYFKRRQRRDSISVP